MSQDQPKKDSAFNKIMWVFLGVFVLLFLGGSNCNKEKKKVVPISATAIQLYDDYHDNEVGADDKYKGKLLEVTGVMVDIQKDIFGKPQISLKARGDILRVVIVSYENDNYVKWLSTLKKGDLVTIEGIGDGMTLGVPLVRVE